eukprot:3008507-Rhodomonas_salina.3
MCGDANDVPEACVVLQKAVQAPVFQVPADKPAVRRAVLTQTTLLPGHQPERLLLAGPAPQHGMGAD